MRRVEPTHQSWDAAVRPYQERADDFLCSHGAAGLFLRPGMGKTGVVLRAFLRLQEANIASQMLVIAPKRVCELVWAQEAQKWTEFRNLRFSQLAGLDADKRKKALKADADIYLINPESVPWLCDQYFGKQRLPFDTITIDELTRFKNSAALRSKKLQKFADKTSRMWGLTGTPAPNGYMDLFGQMKMLDGGAALGRYITQYRDRYFILGRDGFSFDLRPESAALIEEAIAPYIMYERAEDHIDLPTLVDNKIMLDLAPAQRKLYREMKKDMIVQLDGQTVTAANAAAAYAKLSQMANGAVYTSAPNYVELHSVKLDAVEELLEELQGQPVIIAYEFNHDLERLQKRFPWLRHIGGGVSSKDAAEIEGAWNRNELPALALHPASAAHGLNLQIGSACNICWFSQTWDAELYDQLINRIRRSGSAATHVFNHKLIVKDTIDGEKSDAVDGKETTQKRLLDALKSELSEGDIEMRRMVTGGAPAQTTQAAPASAQAQTAPAGSKTPAGWNKATSGGNDGQKETIDAKLTQRQISSGAEDRVEEEGPVNGAAGFSENIQKQLAPDAGVWEEQPDAPAPGLVTHTLKDQPKARAVKSKADAVAEIAAFAPKYYTLTIDAAAVLNAMHAAGSEAPDEDALDYIAKVIALTK